MGHLLVPTDPGHRLDMHAIAPRTPQAPRRIAQRHRDPPQRHMAKAPWRPGIAVRAPRPTLAAPGQETPIWGQLGHQSARVSRHRHDPKPLQFHRRLDQTFQEHESPLRYLGCLATPKYLMRLVFFNSQPASTCIHSCEEPKKTRSATGEGSLGGATRTVKGRRARERQSPRRQSSSPTRRPLGYCG